MSDPIMQKLDEMQALTYSSSAQQTITASALVIVVLSDAIKAALREHYQNGVERDCTCCSPACACGHWECPCPTVKAITKALGVES